MVNYYNSLLDTVRALCEKNPDGFTSITINSKTLRFHFNKDYTPIDINVVDNQDIINLNILFNYIMNGAKVSTRQLNTEESDVDAVYDVDMSFENIEENSYVFDLKDFINEGDIEGVVKLQKDPLVEPHLKCILEHAEFVYHFTTTYDFSSYNNKTVKYNDHLEVTYKLNYDTGSYDIIIKTSK